MEEVKVWLKDQGLENLTDLFLSQGFDELFIVAQLDENRLDELGITKVGVKLKLLDRINKLKTSTTNMSALIPSQYHIQNISEQNSLDNLYPPNMSYYRPPNLVLTPDRTKGRLYGRGPYRCNLCCELKIRDTETKTKHICKPELIGHRWEDCPTRYLANHPEALAKLKEEKKEAKRLKKEEKKKERDLQRWQPRKKRKERTKEDDDVHDPGESPEESHLNNAALAQIEKIRHNMKLIVDNPILWSERMETDNTFLTIMLSLYEHLTSYSPTTPESGPQTPPTVTTPSASLIGLQTNGIAPLVSGVTGPQSLPRSSSPDLHHPQSVATGSVNLNAQGLSPSHVSPPNVSLHSQNSTSGPSSVPTHHHTAHLEC